jgi:hypothetical protein
VRARNAVIDGVVVSIIPAAEAASIARTWERAHDAMPDGWQPEDDLANAVSVMRTAHLVDPDEACCFVFESVPGGMRESVPVATAAELSDLHGVSPQWIGKLCDREHGPFPGARKSGGVWLIPTAEFEAWHDQREQDAAA